MLKVLANGREWNSTEIAVHTGLSQRTVKARLRKGFDFEAELSAPSKVQTFTAYGILYTVAQASFKSGLHEETIRRRMRRGLPGELIMSNERLDRKMLLRANGRTYTVKEAAEITGMSERGIHTRIRSGMSHERVISVGKFSRPRECDVPEGDPGSITWRMLPFAEDKTAREYAAYAERVGGFSFQRVADIMGVTRQRVEQIERIALRKLRLKGGKEARELLEAIQEIDSGRR
jgi:DNA-directed RNA polymerase specialized sigma24 family protein